MSSKHDAPGQLSGYLYQVLTALLLLLQNKEPQAQICVEKFDDVAFVENDIPSIMIQTKHQLYKRGSLINTSVDLWRTIKSWCDAIISDKCWLNDTDFVIVTTATANNCTAASYLSKTNLRDYKKALNILVETAQTDTGVTNKKYYDAFLKLDDKLRENLVKHIYIFDSSSTIVEVKKDIMSYIRFATLEIYEDKVYDKIIGWWINSIIQCLYSDIPIYINRSQLQNVIYDIGSEYKADSLPIDVDAYYNPTEDELNELSSENRIFIEQLKLVSISKERLKRCIRDYYNAFSQRSLWVREQLLFVNELKKYEEVLIDEWNRLYLIMKENLDDYGDDLSDTQKEKAGQKLFGQIEDLNFSIRERVTQPFIMRGTYHELANQLKVGWHIDFMDRLCHLLKG